MYGFKILCEISKVPFEISQKILNPYTAFCVKFQRYPLKFHKKNFEPIHRKMCILQGVKNLTIYDILELWHLKS